MAFLLRKFLKGPPISLSPFSLSSSSLLRFLSSQTPPPSPSPSPNPLHLIPVLNGNQHPCDPHCTNPVGGFLRLIIQKDEGMSYPCLAQLVENGENGNVEVGSSEDDGMMVWADSVKRKRKKKMNKHKYKKRSKMLSRKS